MTARIGALLCITYLLHAQSTGTITGIVSDAVTHQPISALVTMGGDSRTVTGEDGNYTLRDVAAGESGIRVSASGYHLLEEPISIGIGQVLRHDVELRPMARLTVRLLDADSSEALDRKVLLRPKTLHATEGSMAPSDARGETVFTNLEAGDYLLQVDSDPPEFASDESNPKMGSKAYAPDWYPGVPRESMAQPIHVGDGERREIDFRIRSRSVFRVDGVIEAPRGYEGDPVSMRLESLQFRFAWPANTRPRDRFHLSNLPPGKYEIVAMTGKPSDWEYAEAEFEVVDRNIDDLKLSFRPMASLYGTSRMAEDGVAVPANLLPFVVPVEARNAPMAPFDGSLFRVSNTRGMFRAQGLAPGNYNVAVRNLPEGYALADIVYGNVSVLDHPFRLEDVGQLMLVLTSKAGAISGTIHTAGDQPGPKHALLLVPDSFSADSSMLRISQTESDTHGSFAFRNLAPGNYRLLLLDDQSLNAAAIAGRMAAGQTVEVRPSATTAVTIERRRD